MASSPFRVEITQRADEDFRRAAAYYLRVAGRASAEKFITRYEEVLDYLSDIPTAAARIGKTDYRWLPVRSHVLVFKVDEGSRTVYIARLHYASSNWRENTR